MNKVEPIAVVGVHGSADPPMVAHSVEEAKELLGEPFSVSMNGRAGAPPQIGAPLVGRAVDFERKVSPVFIKAGHEAVALRLRWSDADSALDALGEELTDRPEIANDPELLELAQEADHALSAYRQALTDKLRKLCGVVP